MRTFLTALFMTLSTQVYAEQSRSAMRECFTEVENVIVMVDKLRESFEVAFNESLYGDQVASMFFDFRTSGHLEKVFKEVDHVAIEDLSFEQQSELLLKVKNFLSIRSITAERIAKLADIIAVTDDHLKIADAKADYVQACVKSMKDNKHFINLQQSLDEAIKLDNSTRSADELVDDAQPQLGSAPLTESEIDRFRKQASNCWAINVGSRAAKVAVTVSMNMHPDGKIVRSSIAMVNFEGGNTTYANFAFQAARRALYRCQGDGYDLPKEKYEHWRSIKLTFSSAMRSR